MSVPVWINGLAYLPAVEHEALAAELAALEADDRKDLNEALLRIRSLESALREMELQRDSWKRIAESGLGLTACTCDSTFVTDTSRHERDCPRYVAGTFSERAIPPNAKPDDPAPVCGHARQGRKRDKFGNEHCAYCGIDLKAETDVQRMASALDIDLPQSQTPAPRAHSKSEYKRLTALGVECSPPETPEAMHARIVTETADAIVDMNRKGGYAPETKGDAT